MFHVLRDDLIYRVHFVVRYLFVAKRSAALADADDHFLVLNFALVAALLSAYIGFVYFHDALHFGRVRLHHDFADTMGQIPRGPVLDPQSAGADWRRFPFWIR